MRLRLTHALTDPAGRLVDAVGREEDTGRTFVVPGALPCGECGLCRRGLVAVCERTQRPSLSTDVQELPDRFLHPVDDASALDAHGVAGVVAGMIDLTARVGLGPGDVAIVLGDDAYSAALADWCAARGLRAFHAGAAVPTRAERLVGDPATWDERLVTPADGHGVSSAERKVFLPVPTDALARAAVSLLRAGDSWVIGASPLAVMLPLDRLPLVRVLVHTGRHPDFMPEAVASLRRGDVDPHALVRALGYAWRSLSP